MPDNDSALWLLIAYGAYILAVAGYISTIAILVAASVMVREFYQALIREEREDMYWRPPAIQLDPTRSIRNRVFQNLNVYQEYRTRY